VQRHPGRLPPCASPTAARSSPARPARRAHAEVRVDVGLDQLALLIEDHLACARRAWRRAGSYSDTGSTSEPSVVMLVLGQRHAVRVAIEGSRGVENREEEEIVGTEQGTDSVKSE
jgi:hypothetical protein